MMLRSAAAPPPPPAAPPAASVASAAAAFPPRLRLLPPQPPQPVSHSREICGRDETRVAVQGVSATFGALSQARGEGGLGKWSLGIAKQTAPLVVYKRLRSGLCFPSQGGGGGAAEPPKWPGQMRQVCCSALPPPPLEKARCSSYSDSSSSGGSSERSSSGSSGSRSSSGSSGGSISRPAAPPEPRPPQQPQPRSPAARRAAARSRAAAAGGMRRDPAPGFSMLLFGVSLACYSPSLKSVQDQAYKAPVVVEGKVQGLAPAGGSGSNSTREPPASGRVALVKVLDKWPLRSGGLQREQVISVGSCAPLERNQRYIFFLEPTEQPLVFKTAFAPIDTNGKNLKKEVGKILCTDCGSSPDSSAWHPKAFHIPTQPPFIRLIPTSDLLKPSVVRQSQTIYSRAPSTFACWDPYASSLNRPSSFCASQFSSSFPVQLQSSLPKSSQTPGVHRDPSSAQHFQHEGLYCFLWHIFKKLW
uniref:SKI family transcriptional corepressor 2-like n=1 Tax=Halichoerus grypus TaxID=9711 RepID=UPI001659E48B|nr:SKI family transcriptional corepressor 2-like [Halichoerus grypus]